MKKNLILFLIILFLILITAVFKFGFEKDNSKISNNKAMITVAGHRLEVEVADEPQEQSQGLSEREELAQDQGMLFIFPAPAKPGFWMKDMKFAIDIIWINEKGEIIGITKNISPNTFPEVFYPPSKIKYVLEINAGWSDRNNTKVGDRIIEF